MQSLDIAGYPVNFDQHNTETGSGTRIALHWPETPPPRIYEAALQAARQWCEELIGENQNCTANVHTERNPNCTANVHGEAKDIVIVAFASGREYANGLYQGVDALKTTLKTLQLAQGAGIGESGGDAGGIKEEVHA